MTSASNKRARPSAASSCVALAHMFRAHKHGKGKEKTIVFKHLLGLMSCLDAYDFFLSIFPRCCRRAAGSIETGGLLCVALPAAAAASPITLHLLYSCYTTHCYLDTDNPLWTWALSRIEKTLRLTPLA